MPYGGLYNAGFIVIRVGGIDVTEDVIFSDAMFTQSVNGRPGRFHLRVKDADQTRSFTAGVRVTLDIQNYRQFDGYAFMVSRKYAFPVDDVTNPDTTERFWELEGPDLNILFQKRFVYFQSDPSKKLPTYPAGTSDKDIIEDMVDRMLDLAGDDIEMGIEEVGSPNPDFRGSVADIGMSWGQAMSFVSGLPGGIFYLTPGRTLRYVDDDTANAPWPITDDPPEWEDIPQNGPFNWLYHPVVDTWQANHAYTFEDVIVVGTDVWVWDFDTGTSGSTIPDFDPGIGFVADGDGGWALVAIWVANGGVSLGNWAQPTTTNGAYYSADGNSTTGETEPIWETDGDPTPDGGGVEPGDEDFPSRIGYSNMTWTSDGTKLVNDALVWGAGTGKPRAVFGRYEDDESIEEHGRWQFPDQYRYDMYKQATVDRVAESIVLGSPQNLRGAKDPPSQVQCRIQEHGYQAGMKVQVICETFEMDEVIPIREMKITFPTPYNVFYDLSLWHEVDQPWNMAEFYYPPFPGFPGFPGFPPFPPITRIEPEVHEYTQYCVLDDSGDMGLGDFELYFANHGTASNSTIELYSAPGAFTVPYVQVVHEYGCLNTSLNVLVKTPSVSPGPDEAHEFNIGLLNPGEGLGPQGGIFIGPDGDTLGVQAFAPGGGFADSTISSISAGEEVWLSVAIDGGSGIVTANIRRPGILTAEAGAGTLGSWDPRTHVGMEARDNPIDTVDLSGATWQILAMNIASCEGAFCPPLPPGLTGQVYGPVTVGIGDGHSLQFTVPGAFEPGTLIAYVNDVSVIIDTANPETGEFTLVNPPPLGAVVSASWKIPSNAPGAIPIGQIVESRIGNGDSSYITAAAYLEDSLNIYSDGALLIPGTDYTEDPETHTIVFSNPQTGHLTLTYISIEEATGDVVGGGEGGGGGEG